MKHIKSKNYTGKNAWDALNIAVMNNISIRLHWTNKPYIWHTNDGDEVFAVLSGTVYMHYKDSNIEKIVHLEEGDIFYAKIGLEHIAKPDGEARILVIEKSGSI